MNLNETEKSVEKLVEESEGDGEQDVGDKIRTRVGHVSQSLRVAVVEYNYQGENREKLAEGEQDDASDG